MLQKFDAEAVEFAFAPTPRNRPFTDFLASMCGHEPAGTIRLTTETILKLAPKIYYEIKGVRHGSSTRQADEMFSGGFTAIRERH
jgi:hypothetical protein